MADGDSPRVPDLEAVIPRNIALGIIAIGVINILGGLSAIASEEARRRTVQAERIASPLTADPRLYPPPSAALDAGGGAEAAPQHDAAAVSQPSGQTAGSTIDPPAQTGPQGAAATPTAARQSPSPTTASPQVPAAAMINNEPLQVVPTVLGGIIATVLPAIPTTAPPTPTAPAASTPTATPPPANSTATAAATTPTTVSNVLTATDYGSLSAAVAATREGQTLRIPAGEYRVKGPVYPRSNTTFQFEPGSTVRFIGSDDGFVFEDVSNVTVRGLRSYHESTTKTGRNIRTLNASDIRLIDISVERSGSIGVSIDVSRDVLIDGYVNTDEAVHPGNVDDALNIRNSHDVTVRNFDLWVADDAISLKTMGNLSGQTYNILIENGVVRSRDSGIAFGTEIDKPIYNVTIRNVEFVNSGNPIYFKRNDGKYRAIISDIVVENIRARGSGMQRFVFVYAKSETANLVRGLTLRDAVFDGETQFQSFYFPHNDPETNDIVFEDVRVNGKAVEQ